MELKGKVALFTINKTTVDITDVAAGEVVLQHDAQGTHDFGGAFVQKNIAAMAVFKPFPSVHVMNLETGVMLHKFKLPDGWDARVALSKDALTLAVGNSAGMVMMMMMLLLMLLYLLLSFD